MPSSISFANYAVLPCSIWKRCVNKKNKWRFKASLLWWSNEGCRVTYVEPSKYAQAQSMIQCVKYINCKVQKQIKNTQIPDNYFCRIW